MSEVDAPLRDTVAERRALGAALRDSDSLEMVLRELRLHDFSDSAHNAVFSLLSARSTAGDSVDPMLLADLLVGHPQMADDRPDEVVANLLTDAATPSALPDYLKRVRAASDARGLVDVSREMLSNALNSNGDPNAVQTALMKADNALRDVTDRVIAAPWESIFDLTSNMEEGEHLQPLFATGFPQLDRVLEGGPKAGQLWIVAGRPAQGKSTLGLDIARNASIKQGVPGLLISLEMSGTEIAARFMAAESGIPLSNIQSNHVEDADLAKMDSVVERIASAPLYVIDSLEPSLPAIVTTIQAAHRRLNIGYVEVDYSGLVTSDGNPNSSREQIVASVSRTLKALARRLRICIIMVAQLNRGPEQRADKRPQISDLRESGQQEQDADVALLVFRPEEYDPMTERQGEADIIVAKHRNGGKGTVVLGFQGAYARFVSLTREDAPNDLYDSAPTVGAGTYDDDAATTWADSAADA